MAAMSDIGDWLEQLADTSKSTGVKHALGEVTQIVDAPSAAWLAQTRESMTLFILEPRILHRLTGTLDEIEGCYCAAPITRDAKYSLTVGWAGEVTRTWSFEIPGFEQLDIALRPDDDERATHFAHKLAREIADARARGDA